MSKVKINFEDNLPISVPFGTIASGTMFAFRNSPDTICLKGNFDEEYFVLGTESCHTEDNPDEPVYLLSNVDITYSILG